MVGGDGIRVRSGLWGGGPPTISLGPITPNVADERGGWVTPHPTVRGEVGVGGCVEVVVKEAEGGGRGPIRCTWWVVGGYGSSLHSIPTSHEQKPVTLNPRPSFAHTWRGVGKGSGWVGRGGVEAVIEEAGRGGGDSVRCAWSVGVGERGPGVEGFMVTGLCNSTGENWREESVGVRQNCVRVS